MGSVLPTRSRNKSFLCQAERHLADVSFCHWPKTGHSTGSRIMCLSTQDIFKQRWSGPKAHKQLHLQSSQTTTPSSVVRKLLLFFPSFLMYVSATSSLPISIFYCALWFHLAKPLPQLWLPWTCRAYVFTAEHGVVQGWKYALSPVFVRLMMANGPWSQTLILSS